MSIFEKSFYLRPILIVQQKETKSISHLFVGQVEDKVKTILIKLHEKKGDINKLSSSSAKILDSFYGKNLPILRKKIKQADYLVFETIYMSDSVLNIKKKIFVYLSDKNNILSPQNQYLYIKHKVDDRFFLEIIENMYSQVTSLSKKEVKKELMKILDKKIDLDKKIYLQNDLKQTLLEHFRERSNNYYNLPLSIQFLDKSNDLCIPEYANPLNNKEEENLHQDKTINNDYTLLNNYSFDHSIFLVDLEDYRKHSNYNSYIEDRYWLTPKNVTASEFDSKKKSFLEIFKSFDDKINRIYDSNQFLLNQKLEEEGMGKFNEICNDKINAIRLLYNPILEYNINLVKLFDIFRVSREIPFINYVGEKRKQPRMKIYEPSYYGDEVEINELVLKQWKSEKITHEEEGYLTKKHYMNMKCKYKDSFISFYISAKGTIIINLTSFSIHKKNLFNIDTAEVIKIINNLVIKNINKTLGIEKSKNKLEEIKLKYVQYLQFSGSKEVKLLKNLNPQILSRLINHYHEFIFLKFKQTKDDIELGLKKKKNNYGLKRVDNFGSIKDIESYISQLILESNNELDTKVIESKIQNSFSLTKQEATDIYRNLIKNLTDAVHDEGDAEKINILSLVRKNLRNHKEHITFQMYQIGDNLNVNFSHVQNETELVFLNNFLNLVIKEFLLKKKYTVSKVETKIEAQEKKMDAVFDKQINIQEDLFQNSAGNNSLFFDNSDSNNSNNSNNNGSAEDGDGSDNVAGGEDNASRLNNNQGEDDNSLPSIPLDDEPIEYDNLKEYFTEMRARYDPELFISKRKTKDKLITDKKEEAKIKYTTRCQSVNDKFPIIISKNRLKAIQENPKHLEGLDVFQYQELDKKTGQVVKQKATYYILGGHKNKNVYICPRIWCVRCEIPISPIDFVKKNVCPQCSGKVLKDKKEKITSQKTVYVRNHPNTWKDTKDKSFLNRFLNEVLNPNYKKNHKLEQLVIKELNESQKSMYPYYLKPQKIDKNIALACCGSKTLPVEDEDVVEKTGNKGETIYYFLTKSDVIEQDKLAFLGENLAYLLGNEKEKKSRKQFKYYFQLLGRKYIYNDNFKQRTKFFRLGVEPSVRNGFTMCLNYALYFQAKIENPEAENIYYIEKIFDNPDIYKPSLFVQLVNGNAVELFRNKQTINEYLDDADAINKGITIQNFKDWIKLYQLDLEKLGIQGIDTFNYSKLKENSTVNQLWNIYTGFQYFRKYMLDSSVNKNMEFVWDFFQRENVICPSGVNIIILELNTDFKQTQYSLVCPKYYAGEDFYKKDRPSLIVLKYGKSFEIITQLDFRFKQAEIQNAKILLPPVTLRKMKPENLLSILIEKCSKVGVDQRKVRLGQLIKQLDRNNLPAKYEIKQYVRGKYPKIIGVILKNKLYLPVYPESIKDYQLGNIMSIQDLKKKEVLSLQDFLEHHQLLKDTSKFFSYLEIKHVFMEPDTEEKEGLGFVRLSIETLVPIKKFKPKELSVLGKYYREEKVNYILTGIHPVEEEKGKKGKEGLNNQQKLDEFSVDDLIFDQEMPEDERTSYIKNYQNNEKEFKNIILGVNSYFSYEKNLKVSKTILKIILNPVLPLSKKRREIADIFEEHNIFDLLFLFTDKKYFKKKVPIVACYQTENVSQCKKDTDKKYKIPISELNLVNGYPNRELFQNLIIEEMIRNVSYGKKILTQKIEEYELKSLDSIEKKDQIIFGADSLERIFHRLYSKRKVKFLRDVDNVDSKREFQDVEYSALQEKDGAVESENNNYNSLVGDDVASNSKITINLHTKGKKSKGSSVQVEPSGKKTKKRIKVKPSSILVATQNEREARDVNSGNTDMFGIKDKSAKVQGGKCVFPFNMTTRQKVAGKNISRPWHAYDDCVLSREGPFCATEVKHTKKAVKGKLTRLAEYQETEKHPSKKGYCLWDDFFKRELAGRLKGKKQNPKCQEEYKIFKDTGDGKKKLVDIKGCIPDQVENIDVENPRYVCPNKKEVKKGEVFYKSKHRQEDCYV